MLHLSDTICVAHCSYVPNRQHIKTVHSKFVHQVNLCAFGFSTRCLLIAIRLKAKCRFCMTIVHILVLYSITSTITRVAYFVRFMTM